jgi:hypothetical protein
MVVDITPNQTPALVGRTPCQGFYRDLFGVGSNLVCSGNSEVDIYNVDELPEVSLISHFKGFGGKKIAPDVHRDLIFVLNEVSGCRDHKYSQTKEPKLLSIASARKTFHKIIVLSESPCMITNFYCLLTT